MSKRVRKMKKSQEERRCQSFPPTACIQMRKVKMLSGWFVENLRICWELSIFFSTPSKSCLLSLT